jgi:hypothetical protein
MHLETKPCSRITNLAVDGVAGHERIPEFGRDVVIGNLEQPVQGLRKVRSNFKNKLL